MATAVAPTTERSETLADLLERLGGIPLERIRLHPPPGTATEQHVLAALAADGRACELVDGVLVEKAVGYTESVLAMLLVELLNTFVRSRNLGLVSGEHGLMRLFAGRVRIPDVAFVSWDRLPGRRRPEQPIPDLVPDLAVEVLSAGNTAAEMERKVQEYLRVGVRLVWVVDPVARTVLEHQPSVDAKLLRAGDSLTGDPVLPGFRLDLSTLFAELDRRG